MPPGRLLRSPSGLALKGDRPTEITEPAGRTTLHSCCIKASRESRCILAEVGVRAAMPSHVAMDGAGETDE